ncbi:MAG: hypothetical protein CBB86_04505 [Candidatus Endolissoclinum sp. TMED26]|nr:MAG: hypothetical protein CBB86_04505 [Candidatus Endolissoclinum sp. TMED26]
MPIYSFFESDHHCARRLTIGHDVGTAAGAPPRLGHKLQPNQQNSCILTAVEPNPGRPLGAGQTNHRLSYEAGDFFMVFV